MLQLECCSIQQLYIVFPWLQLLLNIGAAANEFLCLACVFRIIEIQAQFSCTLAWCAQRLSGTEYHWN